MIIEIPDCKRCCCCLPLRYGLIVWGYIKLFSAFSALVITIIIILWESKSYESLEAIIILSLLIFTIIMENIFAILFICGCHLKNARLMKIFYFYSMFPLALTVLISLLVWYLIMTDLAFVFEYYFTFHSMLADVSGGALMLMYIGLQVYILLLVRSEIIKLENGYQFRFVNNVTETECTINMEHQNDLKVYEEDVKEITT